MENNWQIADDKGVIHTGDENTMSLAFDHMTYTIEELQEIHPDAEESELSKEVEKWSRPIEGELKLMKIVARCWSKS